MAVNHNVLKSAWLQSCQILVVRLPLKSDTDIYISIICAWPFFVEQTERHGWSHFLTANTAVNRFSIFSINLSQEWDTSQTWHFEIEDMAEKTGTKRMCYTEVKLKQMPHQNYNIMSLLQIYFLTNLYVNSNITFTWYKY